MSQRRRQQTAATGSDGSGGSGQGARLAEELVGEAEQTVEQLEKRAGWPKKAEAHLGPAPRGTADGEEATVWYFAYGSNINRKVFEGRRMIKAAESLPAVLPGWRLEFSAPGLPYSEPAFAAVEPQPSEEQNGSANGASGAPAGRPDVHGVLHRITPSQWRYVLETEGASGQNNDAGYTVVEATAVTYDGRDVHGVVTLSVPVTGRERLRGRTALPSLRYMKLIREGAADFGLEPSYQAWLGQLPHYEAATAGQKVGKLLFGAVAFTGIFPVWAAARLLRQFTGMQAASSGDLASRFLSAYTAAAFKAVLSLHEVVRPVLGCGMTMAAASEPAGGQAKRLQ